jgi:transposase InsO family protein
MSLATPIALERLCQLAQVSRAGYYRWHDAPPAADPDLDLRDEIQRIALESPSYGWPRITAELKRRGWEVNHKRVYRIMREDNLLCLRRRKYVVTTNSHHNRPVYPNLAGTMVLTGINQLWVADITYIRLEIEFVYLAVVLDAWTEHWKANSLSQRCAWLCSAAFRRRAWSIIPTAAYSTPHRNTRIC